jgi:hypothetical protein
MDFKKLFSDSNSSETSGGGIADSTAWILNCTIADNYAPEAAGCICVRIRQKQHYLEQ